MYNCFNRYVLNMFKVIYRNIIKILVLVSANMMGQVNDAPPIGDFSAFYDSGQAYQHTSPMLHGPCLVTKSTWITDMPR